MSTELTTTIKASLDVYKGKFETKLVEFKKTHAGLVYKMEEEEQRTKARADRREVNKVIKELDEEHDTIKAPFLEASRIVDATRKNIKDEFNLLSNGIGDQLKAHDAKIQERLDFISSFTDIDASKLTSACVQVSIDNLLTIDIDDSFCDKKADAALIKEQTLQKLQGLLEQAEKDEELERLRKEAAERETKAREDQIAKDAADKATKDALAAAAKEKEKAGIAAQAALDRVQQEKDALADSSAQSIKDAQKRADEALAAERARIEQEASKIAAAAKAKQDAEDAKKAKQTHRAKIHKQAKESLIANGFDEKQATKIVELIRDGNVKNIEIIY